MKKKKLGFTLAEISTAMGIVGVIFALVIPLISNNIEQQKSGATLGRMVEQVTLGNQNMIQFANSNRNDSSYSDTLSAVTQKDLGLNAAEVSILSTDFANVVPAYWGLNKSKIASSTILDIKSFSGAANDADAKSKMQSGTCYNFAKHSGAVCVYSDGVNLSSDLLQPTGYTAYFDVNGLAVRPNRVGRDIFAFDILNSGGLAPATTGEAGKHARAVVEDGYRNTGRRAD